MFHSAAFIDSFPESSAPSFFFFFTFIYSFLCLHIVPFTTVKDVLCSVKYEIKGLILGVNGLKGFTGTVIQHVLETHKISFKI